MPKLPELPNPEEILSVVDKANNILDKGLGVIDSIANGFDKASQRFAPESEAEPAASREQPEDLIASGTACIPCSRDHLSTASSSLSEGIRFAREKGVKDPEVVRRIRIALDELNAMERIDLAPIEIAKLKGAEKELATWTLNQSRNLRHDITAIKDVDAMEQTSARVSQVTEDFMSRLGEIPEEECETCGEVREKLKEFIEKRKREAESVHQRSPG